MRGAAWPLEHWNILQTISIHAPHAGSGLYGIGSGHPVDTDFNPRSPCGERQSKKVKVKEGQRFQSTLPMRGAAGLIKGFANATVISIHAPHAGSGFF